MIVVSIAALPIFLTGYVISRAEGFVFLFYYIAYTSYLILQATEHDALEEFSFVLMIFVVPITIMIAAMVTLGRASDKRLHGMQRPPGSAA
jgi:cation:H+ antiporter